MSSLSHPLRSIDYSNSREQVGLSGEDVRSYVIPEFRRRRNIRNPEIYSLDP